jgi:hypothetical protein
LCNAATANPTALTDSVADIYLGGALSPAVSMTSESVSIGKDVLQERAGAYVQPVTLQVMELALRDGHLGPRQSSQALVPTSANRMRAAGTEFLFATDGSGFDLRPLTGGPAIHFERHESVTLTRPQLQQYAGEYVSEEMGPRQGQSRAVSFLPPWSR